MKIEADDLDETTVTLDPYNSDLNLVLGASRYSAHPLTNEGFAFMWAGVRTTHGVAKGKICYEVKIQEYLDVSHLPADEPNPHVVRVGFSVESSTLQLGEDPLSYGYGGTGKISTNCQFKDFGGSFQSGDVILGVLNMDSDQVQIGYAKNGKFLGWAYRINKSELKGQALFPHILTKNTSFEVNLGQKEKPYFPLPDIVKDYTFVSCVPMEHRINGTRAPKKEECEMIMMCGLPGAGKSFYATEFSAKHPKKKYNILGTNNIIDKMKVMGLPRKRNYAGRWDVLIQMATKCLNKMFEIGSRLRRNYILDQTNVYPTAQRRKMKNFKDFKRIAVVVVPNEAEYKRRCDKRDREEGKEVPDSAVNEMKANFKIPEINDVFDEVNFTELQRAEAEKLVSTYNEDGRAATGPPRKQFRPDSGFENRGGFNSNQGGSPGRGGYSGRGGYEGNSVGYDNRGRSGDSGRGSFNNNRGGFDGARGGYDGGRSYEGNRGGYEGSRGNYDGNRGGYDRNRGGYEGSRGGYERSRGGYEGSRGGYEGSRGGYEGSRGGYEGSRGGYEGSRGGYEGSRGGYEGSRGGYEGNRGGYDDSRGGYDRNRGSYDGNRGGFDSSRGGYEGGQRGYENNRTGYQDRGGFDEGRGIKRGADNGRYDQSPNRGASPAGYGGNSQSNFSSSYGSGSANFGNRGGSSRGGRGRGDFGGSRSSGNQEGFSNSPDQYSGGSYGKEDTFDKGSSYSGRGQRGFQGSQSRGAPRGGATRGGNGNTRGYSRGGYSSNEYGRDSSAQYGGYGDYQDEYGSQSQSSYGSSADTYQKRDSYSSGIQSTFKKEPGTEGRSYEGGSRLPQGTTRPSGRTSTRWSAEEPQNYPQRNTATQDDTYSKYGSQVKTEPVSSTEGSRYDNYSAQSSNYGSYPSSQTAAPSYASTPSYGYQQNATANTASQPWTASQATASTPAGQGTADQTQWSQYYPPPQPQSNQYYNQYYGQSASGTAPSYGYSK